MAAQVLVIYHGNCSDGFCGAWLFHHAFPEAKFHAARHGQAGIPDVLDRHVFLVDFNYNRETTLIICSKAASVTILDHHVTAEADLADLDKQCLREDVCRIIPKVVFDMKKSGARLAWEYLWDIGAFRGYSLKWDTLMLNRQPCRTRAPWLVDYTEDRDLYHWKLPKSREVNAALRSYPYSFEAWDSFGAEGFEALVKEGTAIRRREDQIVRDCVRHARLGTIGDHIVPIVNATVMISEITSELARGKPFAASYFDRDDGMRQWSLRSDPDGLDVSAIAKQYGGGGHKHAAGFGVALVDAAFLARSARDLGGNDGSF